MNIIKHQTGVPSLFKDDFDNMFQGFFSPMKTSSLWKEKNLFPAVDVEEKEQSYLLMADLPGFNKDEIDVSFHNGCLTIEAQHQEQSESKKDDGYMLKERRFGSFFRRLNFGNNIAENDISAKYENGVLELTMPKLNQEPKEPKRKIAVN